MNSQCNQCAQFGHQLARSAFPCLGDYSAPPETYRKQRSALMCPSAGGGGGRGHEGANVFDRSSIRVTARINLYSLVLQIRLLSKPAELPSQWLIQAFSDYVMSTTRCGSRSFENRSLLSFLFVYCGVKI